MGRIVGVVSFAALVALLTIFARPLWQGALLNEGSQTSQAAKPSDRLTANNAPANSTLVPATTIAAAPVTPPAAASVGQSSASGQQASLSPNSQEPLSTVRGVTDSEIRFGISAALSGPTKELGQNMQRGIVAAFNVANANGGVHGRQLRLIAADDGYEPTRTAVTMKQLL
jgi:ABC-type branched-subunit amino acid transport system substrate-binding protein